ncbi:hypothetical protein TL16_g00816 [Triparma laevis f. inornata]|uniref:Uncharacterized protein n=2 Tax=Triparma laevis TaxID=1534972 RepID=A0A9W7FBU5_9STRA|nr:hypothetical protein TL16_g00816 [Triparma laevis f. inornata]GMI09284.1 hypothetical protein TrLO_g2051 [Triparma laevis f. longispina]
MSPSAKHLYDFLDPLIKSSNRVPLYVMPPGAVTSFSVDKSGKDPVICVKLDRRYMRVINDVKEGLGQVTFEVEFTREIRGKLRDGMLVDLTGVLCRRLPLSIKAKVIKMILPKPGDTTLTFSGKVPFLPTISLPLQCSHFQSCEMWRDTVPLED